jgi:hypothetical protein
MTISTTDSKISYNGNGVTTDFAFPYPYLAVADLQVLRVGTTGIVTTLVLNTDYTVSNGTVSVNTAPGVGERLVINRVVEIVQETDYITGDPFPAETHERALDRLTMIAQQHQEQLGRTVIFPSTDQSVSELPPADQRSLRVLGFDANGDLTTYNPASQVTQAENVSYTPAGSGAVATNVQSKLREFVSVKDFGAVGDGVADDTAAIQAAVNYGVQNGISVFAPVGVYQVSTVNVAGVLRFVGEGYNTVLQHTVTAPMFQWSANASYSFFKDLKMLGLGNNSNPDIAMQFFSNGTINRGITFEDTWIENFRGTAIRIPDSIAFSYIRGRVRTNGIRNRATFNPIGAGIEFYNGGTGAFAGVSTACVLVYIDKVSFSGNAYAIFCPDVQVMFYLSVNQSDFQSNGVGIRSIRSRVAYVNNSYFEFNDLGGATLGDGFDSYCRQDNNPSDSRINEITFADAYLKQGESGAIWAANRGTPSIIFANFDTIAERVTELKTNSGAVQIYPSMLSIANPAHALYAGSGNPNGTVAAVRGSLYFRTDQTLDGGSLFVKSSGTSSSTNNWIEALIRFRGTTAQRPTGFGNDQIGIMYFDTTLGRPVWWGGAGWVDATGASV